MATFASTLEAALAYRASGLSVIPVKPDKRPLLHSWKNYQQQIAAESTVRQWFQNGAGVGIVCGKVSGGLVVIDFDTSGLLDKWLEQVPTAAALLPIVKTKKGYHVGFRCPDPPGNLTLAFDATGKKLIETRGEGGYVVAPPSRHAGGGQYEVIAGSLTSIPRVDPETTKLLLDACRTFDESAKRKKGAPQPISGNYDSSPSAYARAALRNEAAKMRAAVEGNRNIQLNKSAFALGQLIGAGELDRAEVESELSGAAMAAGLPDVEIRASLRSGLDAGMKEPRQVRRQAPKQPNDKPPLSLWTADAILDTNFPDPVWAVPDILPTGLGNLAGKSKIGKSWLALQISQSVASGGIVLGRQVEQGPVLYLALEDSPRRLQDRMRKQHWPRGLPVEFVTIGEFHRQFGDLLKGGAQKLAHQIELRAYRLVVVDTLSRAVPGEQNEAHTMTRGLSPLQEIAHAHNCAVLLIDHHHKGSGAYTDVIGDLLGSTAKGAVADTVLGLYKEHGKKGAKLAVTGRDVLEKNLALTMDWELGCWQLVGDADEIELTERRQEVLDALTTLGRAKLKDIAEAVEQDRGNTYRRLQALVSGGHVKVRDGVYSLLDL